MYHLWRIAVKIWALIAVVVYAGACGIATSLPLSTVERLDTSNIIGFEFADPILVDYTVEKIKAALPSETALCYAGFIKDTTYYVPRFINPSDVIGSVLEESLPYRISGIYWRRY